MQKPSNQLKLLTLTISSRIESESNILHYLDMIIETEGSCKQTVTTNVRTFYSLTLVLS